MEVRRQETLKQGQEMIGNRTRVKVVKNKVAPPFKQADFDIMYGEGISQVGSIVDIGTEMEIIAKSGAWYSYKGERLGQGRENVKEFLKQHPAIAAEIDMSIRANISSANVPSSGESEMEPEED
jgi:recombination protein RecA